MAEFMFQNVAYRATVYRTGVLEKHFRVLEVNKKKYSTTSIKRLTIKYKNNFLDQGDMELKTSLPPFDFKGSSDMKNYVLQIVICTSVFFWSITNYSLHE